MADGFTRPTFKYYHTSGATTNVQLKSGPGVLRTVVLNTVGATVGPISILDNTAAGGVLNQTSNPIAVIQTTSGTTAAPSKCVYDCAFQTGLVISNPTTSNTQDITVSYQ